MQHLSRRFMYEVSTDVRQSRKRPREACDEAVSSVHERFHDYEGGVQRGIQANLNSGYGFASKKRALSRNRHHNSLKGNTIDAILPELCITKDPKQFLQLECKTEGRRLLLFYADKDLEAVVNLGYILGDRNLKYNLTEFHNPGQPYALHVVVKGGAHPVVYALTQSLVVQAYEVLFGALKASIINKYGHAGTLETSTTWLFDYQSAAIQAVTKTFQTAMGPPKVRGCAFHFAKALNKKRDELVLGTLCRDDVDVNEFFIRLRHLPFVPDDFRFQFAGDLLAARPHLPPQHATRLEELVRYFTNLWISNNVVKEIWDQFGNRGPRTKNMVRAGTTGCTVVSAAAILILQSLFSFCKYRSTQRKTACRLCSGHWPKLAQKTVHLYTRSCHECQRRKKPPTKPAGLLQPISPPTAPFQQIGMDLLGPFPPSTSGNRWIIVATDYLTRYAETKALPSGTAVEVAKFFIESIVLRHGAPKVLITDRGSSFMAQLTQEILRLSHTSHRRTTAYHPQTNGLTERLNKTIADMISMYVDVEHKTWDEVLPYVTFAYNTAVQETTGFTPFQLVHGRKVTTMLDAMLPHEPSDNESDDAQVVAQRAEEVRQLARLLIQDQQRVDAGRYNLRRRDVHFQPGDRVWVWTPIRRRGLSEKLLKRYFGPYKVLRRLGELNYEVMPDGTRTSSRRPPRPEVVHVVRLKPYYAR
ncbi:hypothetical protein ISCGN_001650 [Ixodes scapularis]